MSLVLASLAVYTDLSIMHLKLLNQKIAIKLNYTHTEIEEERNSRNFEIKINIMDLY
jgi:hypothetical protein